MISDHALWKELQQTLKTQKVVTHGRTSEVLQKFLHEKKTELDEQHELKLAAEEFNRATSVNGGRRRSRRVSFKRNAEKETTGSDLLNCSIGNLGFINFYSSAAPRAKEKESQKNDRLNRSIGNIGVNFSSSTDPRRDKRCGRNHSQRQTSLRVANKAGTSSDTRDMRCAAKCEQRHDVSPVRPRGRSRGQRSGKQGGATNRSNGIRDRNPFPRTGSLRGAKVNLRQQSSARGVDNSTRQVEQLKQKTPRFNLVQRTKSIGGAIINKVNESVRRRGRNHQQAEDSGEPEPWYETALKGGETKGEQDNAFESSFNSSISSFGLPVQRKPFFEGSFDASRSITIEEGPDSNLDESVDCSPPSVALEASLNSLVTTSRRNSNGSIISLTFLDLESFMEEDEYKHDKNNSSDEDDNDNDNNTAPSNDDDCSNGGLPGDLLVMFPTMPRLRTVAA